MLCFLLFLNVFSCRKFILVYLHQAEDNLSDFSLCMYAWWIITVLDRRELVKKPVFKVVCLTGIFVYSLKSRSMNIPLKHSKINNLFLLSTTIRIILSWGATIMNNKNKQTMTSQRNFVTQCRNISVDVCFSLEVQIN